MSEQVNVKLPKLMADHLNRMVGTQGLYETPSEYLSALIRKDMETDISQVHSQIIQGFEDIVEGRYLESTGDWEKDKSLFLQRIAEG